MKQGPKLILASASQARADLLAAIGMPFEQEPSHIQEPSWNGKSAFNRHLMKTAELKAIEVAARHDDSYVLAADTAILFDGKVIGKGKSRAGAIRILQMLSGRTHYITTGVCVVSPGLAPPGRPLKQRKLFCDTTTVTLRDLTPSEISAYTDNPDSASYAGGYALQAGGSAIIRHISGDPTTITGLPVSMTIEALEALGWNNA